MRTTITVGQVQVRTSLPLDTRELRALLKAVASIAVALDAKEPEPERAPIGFSAQVETAPALEPEHFYSDDE